MIALTNIVSMGRYFTLLYKWNQSYLYNKVSVEIFLNFVFCLSLIYLRLFYIFFYNSLVNFNIFSESYFHLMMMIICDLLLERYYLSHLGSFYLLVR